MGEIRVLIVADDPLARAGLGLVMESEAGCQVVGQAATQADLLVEVEAAQPDVVLWDLGWDLGPALARLIEVVDDLPPVVALVPADREGRLVASAWQAGARGVLGRDTIARKLATAVAAVVEGLVVLDRSLDGELRRAPGPPAEEPAGLVEELTAREQEVLQLLAEGLPNKAIARRMGISEHTVKFHVNAILGKLGAQSRTEAVVLATRLGLVLL
jgi:DNA-binding NarL/FixJ family response regulator